MKLCSEEKCSGCGACVNICPKHCIKMVRNSQGFDYPVIDKEKCVECGLCEKVCNNVMSGFEDRTPKAYAVSMKDDVALKQSSSGGAAYAMSKYIVENGGIVFGAAYSENFYVHHIGVSAADDLKKLQGSKYVQSDTEMTFSEVKKLLKSGKKVMYVGTPCQIHGLQSFLKDIDMSNLITCDLLCGGVPSPGMFEKYIDELKSRRGDFESYNFRSKKYGYGYLMQSICGKKETVLSGHESSFIKMVGAGYIRKSCIGCRFGSKSRVGDITIGDFWNLKIPYEEWTRGISLVLVNTPKGNDLMQKLADSVIIQERTMEEAEKSQGCSLTGSKKKPKDYDEFFAEWDKLSWQDLSRRYLTAKSFKARCLEAIPPAVMGGIRNAKRKLQ